jgi:hypothetical protein
VWRCSRALCRGVHNVFVGIGVVGQCPERAPVLSVQHCAQRIDQLLTTTERLFTLCTAAIDNRSSRRLAIRRQGGRRCTAIGVVVVFMDLLIEQRLHRVAQVLQQTRRVGTRLERQPFVQSHQHIATAHIVLNRRSGGGGSGGGTGRPVLLLVDSG